jgi:hypothetical protein
VGLTAKATFSLANTSSFLSKIATGAQQGVMDAANAGFSISTSIVPRDTGALADSITIKNGSDASSAWAAWGPDIFYMFYVEFGTGRRGQESPLHGPGPYKESWPGMVPEPYMRPALDELAGSYLDIVATAIRSAL